MIFLYKKTPELAKEGIQWMW